MTAAVAGPPPIACTLGSGDFQDRVAWIADLNRDDLRSQRRDGLRLELTYAVAALDRVREMVARERKCCAFLTFDVHVERDAVHLVIEAPESACAALDVVFEPFQGRQPDASACRCSPGSQ